MQKKQKAAALTLRGSARLLELSSVEFSQGYRFLIYGPFLHAGIFVI